MRDCKRRPRSVALYDIVAALVHATIDEVVAVLAPDGMLERERRVLLRVEGTPCYSTGFEAAAAALHEGVLKIRMARQRGDGRDMPPSRSCGHVRMPRFRGGRQRRTGAST